MANFTSYEWIPVKAHYMWHPQANHLVTVIRRDNIESDGETLFSKRFGRKVSYREIEETLEAAGFKLTGPWRRGAGKRIVAKAEEVA